MVTTSEPSFHPLSWSPPTREDLIDFIVAIDPWDTPWVQPAPFRPSDAWRVPRSKQRLRCWGFGLG